ncbi:hypothetical protein CFC21_108058 [Triticum aestivum]|uniref:Uncharacterized protein n=5 Tax=Triticinae TaxID=1648030 RepID=A0A453R261_AEGTS|nr:uncharacterized protein LOC109771112 isoform X2 [Aegilops tauschii subsp. strangulata]XP_044440789.1 uncharacterized protein LOC123167018 [Triticum aestivum]KAF7107434.1 hypothetical protein CFC21_108058 [Triticum aestivum]
MALRSPSSTSRRNLGPRYSPPADSLPPTSQAGSGNGARAGVAMKVKEAEHMLANLEEEGVEIDGNIASIINDEIARIKAEAEREKIINVLTRNGRMVLLTIASAAAGFFLGGECYERALYAQLAMIFGEP